MKTIILPGYSLRNKEWAYEIVKKINLGHEVFVHEWRHWLKDVSFSYKYETEKIVEEVGNDKLNIIAKSVGCRVAVNVIPKLKSKIQKIILCGIASTSEDAQKSYKEAFLDFFIENLLVIQNTNDPFVSFTDVKKFIHSINSKIKLTEKPGSEHHYPYPSDFQKFLLN